MAITRTMNTLSRRLPRATGRLVRPMGGDEAALECAPMRPLGGDEAALGGAPMMPQPGNESVCVGAPMQPQSGEVPSATAATWPNTGAMLSHARVHWAP